MVQGRPPLARIRRVAAAGRVGCTCARNVPFCIADGRTTSTWPHTRAPWPCWAAIGHLTRRRRMNLRGVAARVRSVDVTISALAGYLPTKMVMDPVTVKLNEWEDPAARQREGGLCPRSAVPARRREDDQAAWAGAARPRAAQARTRLPLRRGRVVGAAVRAAAPRHHPWPGHRRGGDRRFHGVHRRRGTHPGPRVVAPNPAYPLATHMCGVAAHLAFGLTVAAVTGTAWRLCGIAARP